MSKKKQQAPETTGIDTINDSLTTMTGKIQDNKKIIAICSVVVLAIAAIILAYVYFFRTPGVNKNNDRIGAADLELSLGNDSVALAQYRDIADNGSYEASNRAALQSAILLYQDGKYEEALNYLKKYDVKDEIIGAGAYSLTGDCLVNLDRLNDAVKVYEKAISTSNSNPAYTPFFMMKLARVYAALDNHSKEAEIYNKIIEEYPLYGQAHNIDVEKLADRAALQAAK